MKCLLTTTILAASALVALAAERTIPEKARDTADTIIDKTKEVVVDAARQAGRATRSAWVKTTAYLSDDLPT
jgi:16S rRNA U1498 N3-methylase RsmE